MTNKLTTFLLGTIDSNSALRILRGKSDILRIIWVYACSEWWKLHIQFYKIPSPGAESRSDHEQTDPPNSIPDLRKHNLFTRKRYFDCPLAIVKTKVHFPPPRPSSTWAPTWLPMFRKEPLNINMMPFDLFDPENTLPEYAHGYIHLIKECRSYIKSYNDMLYNTGAKPPLPLLEDDVPRERFDHSDLKNRIAYITIDERPVSGGGRSHRRGGVHVECPGALRSQEIANKSKYTPDIAYYHRWGIGHATDEYLIGGIFLASNVAHSTAVWNCRVHDTFGDIIGPHGSLERIKNVLGPPTKKLEAGELVWLSDRTPHESLPIHIGKTQRQFFRLVVGDISFWFAEHNTPNPTGFQVPSFVPIINGNKFDLMKNRIPIVWECGNQEEIVIAREEAKFRQSLYRNGMGFLADEFLKIGVYNMKTMYEKHSEVRKLIFSLDQNYLSCYTRQYLAWNLRFVM
eukprot:gene13469-14814_t